MSRQSSTAGPPKVTSRRSIIGNTTNPIAIILQAAFAGAVAGIMAAIFMATVGDSTLDEAIAFESSSQAEALPNLSSPQDPAGPSLSRQTQLLGGIIAAIFYGGLHGVVFGTVLAAVRHKITAADDFGRAITLTVAACIAVVLLPAVKYPANPPGVGDPATIGQRTVQYFTLVGAGFACIAVVFILYRYAQSRFDLTSSRLLTALSAAALFAGLLLVWPPTPDAVPADFPADLLWRFRLQSLAALLITWSVLGAGTGWLLTRTVATTVHPPTHQRQ